MNKKQGNVKLRLEKMAIAALNDEEQQRAFYGGLQERNRVMSFYPTLIPYCDVSYMFACLPLNESEGKQ